MLNAVDPTAPITADSSVRLSATVHRKLGLPDLCQPHGAGNGQQGLDSGAGADACRSLRYRARWSRLLCDSVIIHTLQKSEPLNYRA